MADIRGTLIPQDPVGVKKVTHASPMSFVGATRRGTAMLRKVGTNWWKFTLATAGLVVWLAMMWLVVTIWYVVVFGLFGVLAFPYRFMRRGQRKSLAMQKQQLATMQAMLVQQQQALSGSAKEEN